MLDTGNDRLCLSLYVVMDNACHLHLLRSMLLWVSSHTYCTVLLNFQFNSRQLQCSSTEIPKQIKKMSLRLKQEEISADCG